MGPNVGLNVGPSADEDIQTEVGAEVQSWRESGHEGRLWRGDGLKSAVVAWRWAQKCGGGVEMGAEVGLWRGSVWGKVMVVWK